ncbi:MAG: putative baseplate assembly protein [Verrucomicrobia bacterium]|nr:MAG: putative baseplate assembly protein [Verrucomicrobiota bacterium]
MKTPQICLGEERRESVRAASLNGLDYVEITGDDHSTIAVHFLGKAPPAIVIEGQPPRPPLTEKNVRVEGGRRVRDIRVKKVSIHRNEHPREDDWMEITLNKAGDFSLYILRLVETDERGHPIVDRDKSGREQFRPFHGFDPRYAELEFSFKPGCPADLDCKVERICPPEKRVAPEINYLAKDYGSFRQLILDRLALIVPNWRERHVPDIGIALVEILAYAGDYLSYYQDAVGTEAYLETARERISVRRHARLVDYFLHEGCNARAWIFVWSTAKKLTLKRLEIAFMTAPDGTAADGGGALKANEVNNLPAGSFEYYEPMAEEVCFREACNELWFYTWGDLQCCLPRGSTSATLRDAWVPGGQTPPPDEKNDDPHCPPPSRELAPPTRELELQPGDFLLFEEVIGPKTGDPADKDPTRRHVVCLTRVTPIEDPLCRKELPGYKKDFATPLLEIEWCPQDALPFPLCISVIGPADVEPPQSPCRLIENVSVARGNVILVDHGRTIEQQPPFDCVPTERSDVFCEGEGRPSETTITPGRFRPHLTRGPLVFAEPLGKNAPENCCSDHDLCRTMSASALLRQNLCRTVPAVKLTSATSEPGEWQPRTDLLGSESDAPHFVVEVDDEGLAHLRFGDGDAGLMPEAGTLFRATYRIGGGVAGNVGAEAISRVVWPGKLSVSAETLRPRNPLAACGGSAPESIQEAKLFAPRAFRKELQRAIIAKDYAAIVMREFPAEVQRAGAELRWTGGWYSVRVAIDPLGTLKPPDALLERIRCMLQCYRRMGHDVQVVGARYVPIEIEMNICVQPHYLSGHVKAELLDVFQSGLRTNGEPGFFHPDKLTFGDSIYLSRLIAAAQAVEGVESVQVTTLQRRFEAKNFEIEHGLLPIGPLEVARLDGDPVNPENGILKVNLKGGR